MTGLLPRRIIERHGWAQISVSGPGILGRVCRSSVAGAGADAEIGVHSDA